MKNIFRNSLIMSLSAFLFAGCLHDYNLTSATEDKELVTVYANIDGNNDSRVIYEDTGTLLKVDWKETGESFVVVRNFEYTTFTQKSDSKNEFEANELPGENGDFTAYYPATVYIDSGWNIDFTNQSGQLDEKFSFMSATSDDEKKFTFSHKTAIIKPTFKINDKAVLNSSITKIVLKGIVNVKDMSGEGDITVTIPTEGNINNIYIYLPPKDLSSTEIYEAGDIIDMEVYVNDDEEEKLYTGKITVPANKSIECGKVYPLGITLSTESSSSTTCQLPDGPTFNASIKSFISSNTELTSIKFVANSDIENLTEGEQIGESGAYIHVNGSTLEIHTAASIFSFNANCTSMFDKLQAQITSIDFDKCITTYKVTNMSFMFRENYLMSLDVRCFDTSNVTNMDRMFTKSRKLKSLDLSSFDTSNVTNMNRIVALCYILETLDICNFTFKDDVIVTDLFKELGKDLTNTKTNIIVKEKLNIAIPDDAKAIYVDINGTPFE